MKVLIEGPFYRVEQTEDGIIKTTGWGSPTAEQIGEYCARHRAMLKPIAPARSLMDASKIGDLSMSARWRFAQELKKNRTLVSRSAVYGLSPQLQTIMRILIRASGRTDLRGFPSESAALAWLRERD